MASSSHISPKSGLLGAVVLIVRLATLFPGTKFDPFQTSVSPLTGALVVVSTSLNPSIL